MKIKLTVLALLVVGLGMSGTALANLTISSGPQPLPIQSNIPNATDDLALLSFTITADATEALTVVAFTEGGSFATLTAADAIDDIKIYADYAPLGTYGDEDVLLPGTYDAAAMTVTFDAAQDFLATDSWVYFAVATLNGAASTGDDVTIDTDSASFVTTNTVTGNVSGTSKIVRALDANLFTKDLTGAGSKPNGVLDAVYITFDVNGVAKAIDDSNVDSADFASGAHVFDAFDDSVGTDIADNSMIYLTFDELAEDTSTTPNLDYTAGAARIYSLDGEYGLPDFAGVAMADGAGPAIIAAETKDANNDGFLDGVLLTFSEDVIIGADASLRTAVTMSTVDNAINLTSAVITSPGSDQIQIIGTSAMGAEKWDTHRLPTVAIAAGSSVMDADDNEVTAVSGIATTDAASPVLVKGSGRVASTSITLTFSENVMNLADAVIDETDVEYFSTTSGYSIVSVSGGNKVWTATTDSVLTVANVTNDAVRSVAASIKDAAGNVAPVSSVSIYDGVAPTLTDNVALDLNGDGWLDTIKLTFSEAVNEQNMLGWSAEYDTMVFRAPGLDTLMIVGGRSGSWWSGYTYTPLYKVIGVNLTEDADDATAAFGELRARTVLRFDDPVVPNVSDVKGDNIIYLLIMRPDAEKTGSYMFGDTADRPYVSFTGGDKTVGVGIGDFTPNYVASVSGDRADDGAVPQLVEDSAYMVQDGEGYVMSFKISEPVRSNGSSSSLAPARDVFTWVVGTEEVDYFDPNQDGDTGDSYIVNFYQDPDTAQVYYLETNIPVLKLTASELGLRDGTLLRDMNVSGNKLAGGPLDVTMWDEPIVGVEETDVPEVYALSKNFPNPFNPSTTINYDIAGTGGHVSMVIYNMAGQKIRTLVNDVKAPGFYSVVWDGIDDQGMSVSSGIYLYKIISGDFSAIEKMTFVK